MKKDQILIVEDEFVTASAIRVQLTNLGYNVVAVVDTGEEAIRISGELSPDLVLMDIVLKGKMDGISAAEEIRKQFDIPVIFITARTEDEVTKRAIFSEPFGYLIKPLEEKALSITIRMALYKHSIELRLRENEEQYHTLFESANDAIFLMDKDTFIKCNQRTLEIFRCEYEEQIVGHTPLDFSPIKQSDGTSSKDKAKEKIQAAYAGSPQTFEWLHTRMDGSPLYAEVSLNSLKISGKLYLQAIVRDITDRVQAEMALKVSEIRYRRLFESAQDGILILDGKTGYITDTNPYIQNLLGYQREELIGKNLWEIGLAIDMPRAKNAFKLLKKKGYIRYDDIPLVTKDGQQRIVEFVSNLYSANNEQVIQCNIRDISKTKQTYIALCESEERYRRITEAITDYIYTVYLDHGHVVKTRHSAACVPITGYTCEEFNADPYLWIQMVVEEYRPQVKEQANDVLAGKKVSPLEHQIVRKDGKIRWIRNTIIPQYDSTGQILSYEGVIQDITERKLAELKLQESYEMFKKPVEHSPVGIYLIQDGLFRYINPKLAEILGYTRDTLCNRPFESLILPDDRSQVVIALTNRMNGDTVPKNIEFRCIRSDGTIIILEAYGSLMTYQGRAALYGTIIDITERKNLELSVKRSEKKYRTLAEAAPDLIFILDRDNTIQYANPSTLKVFHRSEDQVIGKSRNILFPPHIADIQGKNIDTVFETGMALRNEEEIIIDDGPLWFDTNLVPLTDESGNVTGVLGISHDITEARKNKEFIVQSLLEKEALLKEIHHRVKNNLQVISGILVLQANTVQDEAIRNVFREIQNRIRSMSLVHEQLYQSDNLSQIEYGAYLFTMFHSLSESYQVDTRKISLVIDAPQVMISIEKAVPCSLIVNELFTNSFKHAFPSEKGGEIRIGFSLDKANSTYILDYRDNGVGMPDNLVLKNTRSLGVQLIFGLVQQLNGTVREEHDIGVHYIIMFPSKELRGG